VRRRVRVGTGMRLLQARGDFIHAFPENLKLARRLPHGGCGDRGGRPALPRRARRASVGTTGFALQRFTPAFAGDRFFSVSSPYASGDPGLPRVATCMDYASNPLLVSRVKGITDPTGVVTDQLYLHVNATFAIFDRLALNLDIPPPRS
jgi:hypothetical protein